MRLKHLITAITIIGVGITMAHAQDVKQTAGRTQLGEFAPKFAELNDDVLFGEIWSRTDKLSLRDRSLITVTALFSSGITDSSLIYHLQNAKKNGITKTEIAETYISHLNIVNFVPQYLSIKY